jgi:methionyl-tRNA formyltransferase
VRVVFMGTPAFAVPSLRALAGSHEVVAVYTRPDRPAGRGRQMRSSAVANVAMELGIPVVQPASLRDPVELERLRILAPDVVCVVAYGAILPREMLQIPVHGCLNVHASLLPRHRGAAPIERAILEGDADAGVAIMLMEEALDTGPVAMQVALPVGDADAAGLREALSQSGATALIEVLARIDAGDVRWKTQGEDAATYAAKLAPSDVVLDPTLDPTSLVRRVRASGESAASHAVIAGRLITAEAASLAGGSPGVGSVAVSKDGIVLGCEGGAIVVTRLTPSGKRSMSGLDFARGARLADGATWGTPS